MNACTSFLVTRPPAPVPEIALMSRLCSATMRATTGETNVRPSPLCPLPFAGAAAGVDDGDAGVHRDGLALAGQALSDDAGRRGGDLGVDLVGRDLDDRLVGLDGLTDALRPPGDRA